MSFLFKKYNKCYVVSCWEGQTCLLLCSHAAIFCLVLKLTHVFHSRLSSLPTILSARGVFPRRTFKEEKLERGVVSVSDLLVHNCPICWGWWVWLKQGSLLLLAPPINHIDKSEKGNILPGQRTGGYQFCCRAVVSPPQTSRAVLVEVQTAE